jgi:hypothetical protein
MASAAEKLTAKDIVAQLNKEGVNDLPSFAEYLLKKVHQDGDPNKPIVNAAIIYHHGFVTH